MILLFSSCILSCTQTDKKQEEIAMADTISRHMGSETTDSTQKIPIFKNVVFDKAKGIPISLKLKDVIKETIDSVETVDFNGDQELDYIIRTELDANGLGFEYWISSRYKILKKNKGFSDGFHYRWFINLDDDPEPEIYDALGDEEGAEYTIQDQNLLSGNDTVLLYINPVIIEDNIKYWGYPWDISTVKARKNRHAVQLYCSLNHEITREEGWEIDAKHQSQVPVIFFDGHHTQNFHPKNVKNMQWLTLNEIIDKTKR